MDHKRIIEIAHYWGESQIACHRCGVVHDVDKLTFEDVGNKVKASCPDCKRYIKFMKMDKLWKLFDFDEKKMLPLAEINTRLLKWYLMNPTKHKVQREVIIKELDNR